MSGDEISLTLPADEAFHRVAHLVLAGLAVRLDLTFEHLEDLEVALDALLERPLTEEALTLRVRILDGELRTMVGTAGCLTEFTRIPRNPIRNAAAKNSGHTGRATGA